MYGWRTLPESVSEGHNASLSPFLTCVALVHGALLGFTIVVAWEQFSSAEANVSNEASTLTTMYRQTVGMPVPEQAQIRDLVRKYTKAVEGPKWTDGTCPRGNRCRGRRAQRDVLDQLTTLASERNQRMLDTNPRIPGLLWAGCFSAVSC